GFGLTKAGNGSLVLTQAATSYSGTTTASAGTLVLGNDLALGTGRLTLSSGTLDVTANRTLAANNPMTWGNWTFAGSANLNTGTGAIALPANSALTVTSGTLTVPGSISDGGLGCTVTKNGNGTLVLSGSNFYGGTTNASSGILSIGNPYAISTSRLYLGGGSLDASAPVTLATNNPQTWNNSFSFLGSNPLNLGTGPVYLANTITATVNTGTLTVGGTFTSVGSLTKSGAGTLVLGGNFNVANNQLTVGGGQLTLGGSNGYTGATTVNSGGTLLLANQSAVQNSVVTVNSGGVLAFDQSVVGGGFTIASLQNNGTTVLSTNAASPSPVILTVGGYNNSSSGFNATGVISGLGGITKVGSGTFSLSGANTYSGTTTLVAGLLSLDNAAALGTSRLVITGGTLSTNGNTTLTNNNPQSWNGDFTFYPTAGGGLGMGTGAVTLGGSRAIWGNTTALFTLNGAIGDGGQGFGLTKAGSFPLVLGGSSTYTGATTVNAGLVRLDFSQSSAPTTNILATASSLVLGGGTFNLTGKAGTTNAQTMSGLTLNAGASFISFTQGASNPLLLSVGSITRRAGGTLDLSLSGVQSGSNGLATTATDSSGILGGWLTVNGTTWATTSVVAGVATPLTSGSYTASTAGTTAPGTAANVDFQASNSSAWSTQSVNSLRFNTNAASTLSIAPAGVLTVSSGGILVTTNVGGNPTTISGGSLRGAAGADLVVIQNNTFASGGLTISSTITDNGSATGLTKSGLAPLTLTAVNTYSGTTTLNSGTLILGNDAALGTGRLAINGGSLDVTAARQTTNANAQSWNGDFAFVGSNSLNLGTGAVTLANLPAGGSRTVTVTASTLTVGGTIGDGGSGFGLTKAGAGTLLLGAANTFSGPTTLSAGTLNLSNASAVQNSTLFYTGGTLVFDQSVGGNAFTVGGLSGNQGIALVNNAGTPAAITLTAGGNNASTTYSGVLSGAGGITKTGSGSLTLSGVNTHSGTTALTSGTLVIANDAALGTSRLVINGGTLDVNSAFRSVTGTNAQTWNGDFTFAGSANLNLGTGPVTLGGSPTVTVNANPLIAQSGTLTVGGTISGAGGLTKAGPGTLILGNTNSFQGNLTLAAGRVESVVYSSFGSGTILFTGNSALGFSAGASGTIANNIRLATGVSGTFEFPANYISTLSGTISGPGTLVKSGFSTTSASVIVGLRLTSSNSYSGGTVINGGVLVSGTDYALGSGPIAINTPYPFVASGLQQTALMTLSVNALRGPDNTPLPITMGNQTYLWLAAGVNGGNANYGNNITVLGSGTFYIAGGPKDTTNYASGTSYTLGTLSINGDQTLAMKGDPQNGSTTAFGNVSLGGNLTVSTIASQGSNPLNVSLGAVAETGGPRSLTKLGGAQSLTLTASSSYSGGTYVLAGTLVSGTDYALGSGPLFISSNASGASATLQANSANALRNGLNAPLAITMAPGATLSQPAGLSIAWNNDIQTTAAPGTVTFQFGTAAAVATGSAAFGTLVVNGTQTITMSGRDDARLSFNAVTLNADATFNPTTANANTSLVLGPVGETGGSRSLTKIGNAPLIFSGSNTYTGVTTISAGTLYGGDASLKGPVNLAGGTLNTGTYAGTLNTGTFSGNMALIANSTVTGVFTGNISGGNFLLTTTGSTTLSGSNSFSGGVWSTVNTQLNINSSYALGSGTFTPSNTWNANTSGTSILLSNDFVPTGNGFVWNSGTAETTGVLWQNNGLNNRVGVSGGRLTVSRLDSVNPGSALNAYYGGGVLEIRNAAGSNISGVTTLQFSSTTVIGNRLALGSGTINFVSASLQASTDLTGANAITNTVLFQSGLFPTFSGSSSIELAGPVINGAPANSAFKVYSNIAPGKLLTISGTTFLQESGTSVGRPLELTGTGNTLFTGPIVNGGSGGLSNFTVTNTGTTTFAGLSTYSGTFSQTAAGSVVLSGTMSNLALITMSSGTFTQTTTGAITGATPLAVTSGGLAMLSGSNTYSGTTGVSGGILQFGRPQSLYGGNTASWTKGNIWVNTNGTLALNVGGTGEFTSADVKTLIANILTTGNATGGFQSSSWLGLDTTNAAGGNFTTDAVIAQNGLAGNVGLSKLGSGTLTLTSSNSYGGGTRIFGGVLTVGNTFALGNTSGGMTINSGTLNLGGFSIQVGDLSGSSTAMITTNAVSGTATLTVVPQNGTVTYPGSIIDNGSGRVALSKGGGNTLVLSGTNTYSGSTAILAGTLQATNPASLPGAITNNATLALNFPSGTTTTFGNQVNGSGLVNLLGSGTTILSNTTSSYGGSTNVQAGVLQIASLTNRGTNSVLGSGTASGATISLGSGATGGTLRYTGGVSSTSNRV
ncbi:MAG: hypothetical protein EBZ59_06240, partial [Planctomycetia bacterium]|nr:hypothetical protein [Planctomycetia bacterium]